MPFSRVFLLSMDMARPMRPAAGLRFREQFRGQLGGDPPSGRFDFLTFCEIDEGVLNGPWTIAEKLLIYLLSLIVGCAETTMAFSALDFLQPLPPLSHMAGRIAMYLATASREDAKLEDPWDARASLASLKRWFRPTLGKPTFGRNCRRWIGASFSFALRSCLILEVGWKFTRRPQFQ